MCFSLHFVDKSHYLILMVMINVDIYHSKCEFEFISFLSSNSVTSSQIDG